MSLNKTELANVKRLCQEVITLVDAVEKQAAMQTAGFSAKMQTTYKWVLWPKPNHGRTQTPEHGPHPSLGRPEAILMTWHPLLAAIETCLTRHHTGSNQPAAPSPWMTAAAEQIATAIIQHTTLDQTRHIALLIELGVTA